MQRLAYGNASLAFLLAALACLIAADIAVTALNPWAEMARLLRGLVRPDVLSIEAWSVVWTIAFAVLGVGLGAVCGFGLAILYPVLAPVRMLTTMLRAVHELFWALLLIQVFGLGPTTGLLAIALPYTGFFAKVFSEIIDEADLSAVDVLPRGTSLVSAFFYGHLPELIQPFKTYTLYRLECGLRSTLVLGFVGLPTIGFHLESYFKQGHYAQAAALLGLFYALIGTRRIWVRPVTLPLLILASIVLLPEAVGGGSAFANLSRFLGHDIVPAPLRGHDLASLESWANFALWMQSIVVREVVPGIVQTLVLSQIALVATAILALLAAAILRGHAVHAATDVTGFGLLGHLIEMVKASGVDATLQVAAVPLLDGARETLASGIVSSLQPQNVRLRRAIRNLAEAAKHPLYPMLFDPQTAGGLLASVPGPAAEACLAELRTEGYGQAALIGFVEPLSDVLEPITLDLSELGSGRPERAPSRSGPQASELLEGRPHAHEPVL